MDVALGVHMKKWMGMLCMVCALSACNHKDVGQKTIEFFQDLNEVAELNKSDCAKMGSELKAYIAKHKSVLDEVTAWEKTATDEQKKAQADKYAVQTREQREKLAKALVPCMSDQGVLDALKDLDR